MSIIVNHHCWGSITGADAVGQFEGEFTIRGSLTGFDSDFIGYALDYHLGIFEIAGKAFTNPDYIPAQWLAREKRIEGGYSVYFTYRGVQRFSRLGD